MTMQHPSTVFLNRIHQAGLSDIHQRLETGERLTLDDGMALYECHDLVALGLMANRRREQLHGDLCFFNRNLHINATNVCEASCIFCSFARLKTGDPDSWTLTIQQSVDRIKALDSALISEVHIVNGLNPDLPFEYYLDLLSAVKNARPELHIKGFTAVEIAYYAEKYDMSVEAVLTELRNAGLDSMPGGGAEIFAERARRKLCHDKVDGPGWLDIHRRAHRMGIRTNATMLFGSIETLEERVDHLCQLRQLQDQSLQEGKTDPHHGGAHFQTFIPLRFHNDNNRLNRLASPTGFESLRTIAISRLMLDNFPHIKAYWPMLGTQIAQVAQHFGASDLDGTVREEHIYHMAGAETPQSHSPEALAEFIEKARRRPVERDTLYHVIRRLDAPHLTSQPAPLKQPIRVGVVGYKNARPLTHFLNRPDIDIELGHPFEVARWLREETIDLALLPVAALLHDPIEQGADSGYRVIPDLAIGCDGPVESVLIAAETPPEQWTHVWLDGVSRTSACLAQLLLTQGPLAGRVRPDLKIAPAPPASGIERAHGTHASLIIGDAALQLPDRLNVRVDLGQCWKEWTGLPFVFALWVGRTDLSPEAVETVRMAGISGLQSLRNGDFDPSMDAQTHRYLHHRIRYDLDDRATMGLMRFASLGFRAGLLQREHFSLYSPQTHPSAGRAAWSDKLPIGPSTDVERVLDLYEGAPLLELMAAAGMRNPFERKVSYQAATETHSRPPMVALPSLSGLRVGAHHTTLSLDESNTWFNSEVLHSIKELHVSPGPKTSIKEWAEFLVRLNASSAASLQALWIHPGDDATSPVSTGAEWLGWLALARISCPQLAHILVEPSAHGAGLSQLALHAGATDLGCEDTTSNDNASTIERHIRMAGFQPCRRNAHWNFEDQSTLRPAEALNRPLRRLDTPSRA